MKTVDIATLIAEMAAKGIAVTGVPQEKALSCKIGEKGGLSIYGLNAQFPVTLYRGQWERLIPYLNSDPIFKATLAKCKTKAEMAAAKVAAL